MQKKLKFGVVPLLIFVCLASTVLLSPKTACTTTYQTPIKVQGLAQGTASGTVTSSYFVNAEIWRGADGVGAGKVMTIIVAGGIGLG